MCDPFFYRFVPEDEVPGPVLWAARRALALSEAKLGLSGVKLKWCLPESKLQYEIEEINQKILDNFDRMIGSYSAPVLRVTQRLLRGEFHGSTLPLVYPNAITIRADLKPERVVLTVAHECQHLQDWAQDPSSWGYSNETEARAERFEQEIASALGMKES